MLYDRAVTRRQDDRTGGFLYKKGDQGNSYQPASWYVLEKIFSRLPQKLHNYHFFDIGCGLGRVLLFARKKGFTRISGIELDPGLLETAQHNIYRAGQDQSIALYQADAVSFSYPDEESVYFLFNPFGGKTLSQVLERIRKDNSKKHLIVYMNPVHHDIIRKAGYHEAEHIRTAFYTEATIYQAKTQ